MDSPHSRSVLGDYPYPDTFLVVSNGSPELYDAGGATRIVTRGRRAQWS